MSLSDKDSVLPILLLRCQYQKKSMSSKPSCIISLPSIMGHPSAHVQACNDSARDTTYIDIECGETRQK